MANAGIQRLVDKLESHIYADERQFDKLLRITASTTDQYLDEMFSSDDYDKAEILRMLSVANQEGHEL